jgi:hypothetical protein
MVINTAVIRFFFMAFSLSCLFSTWIKALTRSNVSPLRFSELNLLFFTFVFKTF